MWKAEEASAETNKETEWILISDNDTERVFNLRDFQILCV